jgi:hypothetical protein
MDYEIPKEVIKKLETESERVDLCFSKVWGLLPPSAKRDEIMWHLITAKQKLNEFIKENG